MSTPPSDSRAPDEQFIVRLAVLHHSRDRALSSLMRWNPQHVDPQQLVDVARVTEGDSVIDYEVRAAVGKAFATYHSGKQRVDYGYPGASLGSVLRRLGSAGQGYGPRNVATDRLLQAIVTAETFDDLTGLLARACAELKSDAPAPHWATLLSELEEWHVPATRQNVRLSWAQSFYTTPPKKKATA